MALALAGLRRPSHRLRDSPKTACSSGSARLSSARIEDAIGPVTKDYVHRVLETAATENPECVIFTMDTPGGLDASMRSIVKDILSSPVPVVVFVHPSGARAASAGAIIGLASHILAMAPGTNIGAAHPVAIGQGNMDEEMTEKVTNDAAAYARGIADQRGRDVEWAEKIVRESISSTAEEALALGVVDLIADDLDEPRLEARRARGRASMGKQRTLATEGRGPHRRRTRRFARSSSRRSPIPTSPTFCSSWGSSAFSSSSRTPGRYSPASSAGSPSCSRSSRSSSSR